MRHDDDRACGRRPGCPKSAASSPNLTVAENLKLAQVTARAPGWTLDHVYEKFPRLRERLGNKGDEISGGEKQMLSIARALLQDVKCCCSTSRPKGSRR